MPGKEFLTIPPKRLRKDWEDQITFIGHHTNYVEGHRIRVFKIEEWLGFPFPEERELFNRNIHSSL